LDRECLRDQCAWWFVGWREEGCALRFLAVYADEVRDDGVERRRRGE
jgi:hypothetical protein